MIRTAFDRRVTDPVRVLRLILPLLAAGLCAGCGLAGTAVATGAGATAEVQQASRPSNRRSRQARTGSGPAGRRPAAQ